MQPAVPWRSAAVQVEAAVHIVDVPEFAELLALLVSGVIFAPCHSGPTKPSEPSSLHWRTADKWLDSCAHGAGGTGTGAPETRTRMGLVQYLTRIAVSLTEKGPGGR